MTVKEMTDEKRNEKLRTLDDEVEIAKIGNSFGMLQSAIEDLINRRHTIYTHKKEENLIKGGEGCDTFNSYMIVPYEKGGSLRHCYHCDGAYYSEEPVKEEE